MSRPISARLPVAVVAGPQRVSRRALVSKLLSLLLLLCISAPTLALEEEKALYKLGLVISGTKDKDLDNEVLSKTTEAFVYSRRFTMIERSKLEAVFAEKDLQTFLAKGNQSLWELLGLDLLGLVEYTVETRVSNGTSMSVFAITVRLVDVKTGWILESLTSEHSESIIPPATLGQATRLLFQNIREAVPPFGYVVKIAGKEVVVDLGSEAGLKDGDILEVIREGEQIIHPVTGRVLPAEFTTVGELKIVDIFSQRSTCWLKWENGISLGDPVRLKKEDSALSRWLKFGRRFNPFRGFMD